MSPTIVVLILVSFLSMNPHLLLISAAKQCPNLSPCKCRCPEVFGEIYCTIQCDDVPMEEVKEIFSRISSFDTSVLQLNILPNGDYIPADLLGQSRILKGLYLSGSPPGYYPTLRVDPNAFRNSNNTLQSVTIKELDTSRLDFDFLTGFQMVSQLEFISVMNLDRSVPTLPALATLRNLYFEYTTGLRDAFQSGTSVLQTDGLTNLVASYCDLDEKSLAQLLNWILPSSIQTLKDITIDGNRLGLIPRQLRYFQGLKIIAIRYNTVDLIIQSNSFYIESGEENSAYISLLSSRVIYVEPGAFQGNYSRFRLHMQDNSLTRFEEGVFKSVLQAMSSDTNTRFCADFKTNPFDCNSDPCHLAWLLRDNRHLLDCFENSPRCEGNTLFENLNPSMFDECP